MAEEKVDAWMPLWIGAYLADTMSLTTQQHGAYLLILFAYWRNKGPLPDDDEDMAGITKSSPSEWKKLRPKIAKFFDVADGVWSHWRADKELATAGVRKAAAVSKAKAGAQALWEKRRKHAPSNATGNAPSIDQASLKQCPTPSPTPEDSTESIPPPEGGGDAEDLTAGFTPTPAGAICKALRMAGIADTNPSHPTLLALIEAGATVDEFAGAAPQAVGKSKPFSYVLSVVTNERQRAAGLRLHHGAMPQQMTPGQRAAHERIAAAVPGLAAKPVTTQPLTEVFDVTARLVG